MLPNLSMPLLRALTDTNTVAFEEFATIGVSLPIFLYMLVNDPDWRDREPVCWMGRMGLPLDTIASSLRMQIPPGDAGTKSDEFVFAGDMKVILDLASIVMRRMGEEAVKIEHVILAILQDDEEWGVLLQGFGVTEDIFLELMNRDTP